MSDLTRLYTELRAYKRSRVLAVAVRSGILRSLAFEAQSCNLIAKKTGYEQSWLRPILNTLVELQLVERADDHFRLTADGEMAQHDATLNCFAGYHLHCFEAWKALPKMLSSATGGGFHRTRIADRDFCDSYLRSMDAISQCNLAFLERECEPHLSGRVIDVGAGPATLCRKLAESGLLELTALDLAPVVEAARSLYGETDHMRWVAGDFPAWKPKSTFDALLCSHFLEYCSEDQLDTWLKVLFDYIRPGGKAAFVAFLRPNDTQPQAELDMFEISTGMNGDLLGRCHTKSEISCALARVGFVTIGQYAIPNGPSYNEYLIVCEKPNNGSQLA